MMSIENALHRLTWDEAIGSSGTIRAIGAGDQGRRPRQRRGQRRGPGLGQAQTVQAGRNRQDRLRRHQADRRAIFPAGLAILEAIFDALELQRMDHCDGALREGVLFDLLGRHHHEDVRERTLNSLMERYHVDQGQAARVERKALHAFDQVAKAWDLEDGVGAICWAGPRKCTKWGWTSPTTTTTSMAPT
jgi:exopolyphosphatase/guanosine-5'-triphosphate,3'-diphosphate pyrophosphatase